MPEPFKSFTPFCYNVEACHSTRDRMWDSPDILCMLISKLPSGIMERWNRKVQNIEDIK